MGSKQDQNGKSKKGRAAAQRGKSHVEMGGAKRSGSRVGRALSKGSDGELEACFSENTEINFEINLFQTTTPKQLNLPGGEQKKDEI